MWIIGGIGLIFGSFLNVLIWRLNDPKAPKFWQGRSICPDCKHTLTWRDNIPLLSYIFLRGKCRYCHKNISIRYPVVELVTAVAFALIGPNPLLLGIASCLIVIFFSDLIYGLIPDEMVIAGVFFVIARNVVTKQSLVCATGDCFAALAMTGTVALLSSFFFFIFYLIKGMGFGDVKFAFLMGLLLGWPGVLVGLWMSFVSGGIVAVILLALRRTKLSATIALGPFLVFGTVFAALWSNNFLQILGLTP